MIIFAGPSIAGLEIPPRIEIRPPAQQGDIYLATLKRPSVIGLIDGYFEGVPSVWHKEILWAMTQGIAVLGASSMGALRSAELEAYGMVGIGAVFEAYQTETLQDDDEVALLHGPQEVGYPALSLAMVNVRATLDAATRALILTPAQAGYVNEKAKSEFYKTRTWNSIFPALDCETIPETTIQALQNWVKTHTVDQKNVDAKMLIDRLRLGDFETPKPTFHFEQTDLWLNATKNWHERDISVPEKRNSGPLPAGGFSFMDE